MLIMANALNIPLADESVQCVVTSPPYWGLRDYGVSGQLGLETTPDEYIANMVRVFAEVRRVLRKDGTCWVNMGDSYYSGDKGGYERPTTGKQATSRGTVKGLTPNRLPQVGLKAKDLVGMPWMLAFALRADGWYLRQDIIWAKPNPMPESVSDRCTKSHEYLFMLTKSARYCFDAEAIAEPVSGGAHARRQKMPDGWETGPGGHGSFHREGREKGRTRDVGVGPKARPAKGVPNEPRVKYNESFSAAIVDLVDDRNKRSVWTIATQAFPEAHFATFPEKLVEPCILAGTKEGDVVLDPFCGSGTTGVVCRRYFRKFVGLELNPEYIEIAKRRLSGEAPLFHGVYA